MSPRTVIAALALLSLTSLASAQTADMRWPFQAWGASAVVAGHAHSYERIMIAGFPYFVNGAGGHGTTAFDITPVAGTVVRYAVPVSVWQSMQ